MTDPGSQRSKRMPLYCLAEIADEKPSRRQFVEFKLIDHGRKNEKGSNSDRSDSQSESEK
jgi:hypothetical protein